MKLLACATLIAALSLTSSAYALDRPWIADVFFYWYTWDYDAQKGSWIGGVYNTPLVGYYDSRSYEDNLRELHMASEWGLTDHFMDFWGPAWKDTEGKPREDALMRAAEALQRRGYDCHMSFYQDATDFDMKSFAANLDAGRQVRWLFENWGRSPALPRILGEPVWLVYGRNGQPEPDEDQNAFRAWLRGKYQTVEALNQAWGAKLTSFDQAALDYGAGARRADSIKYQYYHWAQEMQAMNQRAAGELGLPPIRPSFDVGFQPFRGYDYDDFARVLNGPHTYAGIFGQPQEQDVERFIQTVVAKYHGSVFFDTYKNFYHDWEIRTPGTCYPPEPAHFDRFWVGNLMRYAEAMLHLSWNEWWEGSNLEPCLEYGKTYCQKNLLYATIMKQCFPSIRNWNQGAKIALLLNDWHWLAGGSHPEDIYDCIQALRRENLTFDLIPDDFVTQSKLDGFAVVIAPSGGVGFGVNAEGQQILKLLQQWLEAGQGRKLILSECPDLWNWLGIQPGEAPKPTSKGPDMSVYVDLGVEGDEKFLVSGFSNREDWGRLGPEAFGAAKESYTVRWTPGTGAETTFLLPMSPGRDHLLRLAGSAFRENQVTVLVDGQEAAAFELREGPNEVEVPIPAQALGGRQLGTLTLRYAKANVPGKIDPQKHSGESRVCNLALDWLQFSTDNMAKSTQQQFQWPAERITFTGKMPGPMSGARPEVPYRPHTTISAEQAEVLSRYASDKSPRDLVVSFGDNQALYVNGLLGGFGDERYLRSVLKWTGLEPEYTIRGANVIGTRLQSGDTDILLAYNYDISKPTTVHCRVPTRGRWVSEVVALSRDGEHWREVKYKLDKQTGDLLIEDGIRYYAVYQVVFSPLTLDVGSLELQPGEQKTFKLEVNNIAGRPVQGQMQLLSHLPSISAGEVLFDAAKSEEFSVRLDLQARKDADWGHKTVVFELRAGGLRSCFWRPLTILRPPDLELEQDLVDAADPTVSVRNRELPYVRNGEAPEVTLTSEGQATAFGAIGPGASKSKKLKLDLPAVEQPQVVTRFFDLAYTLGGSADPRAERRVKVVPLHFACAPGEYPRPQDAIAVLLAFNPSQEYLENAVVRLVINPHDLPGDPDLLTLYVREKGGAVVPSQVNATTRELLTLAMLPPEGAATLFICQGQAAHPPSDLSVQPAELGTGHGELSLTSSRLSLTLSEQAGGTLSKLASAASGLDYAAPNCCGVAYGSWGHYDPLSPATSPAKYIGTEEKVRQSDSPAQVTLLESGPVRASAQVEWLSDDARVTQTYEFCAYQDYFKLTTKIQPKGLKKYDELVALDMRLKRGPLSKIYPNFTGITESFDQDQPQHGWREASYVPPLGSFMAPDEYAESVSLILRNTKGLDKWRQGFWPEKRPQPGPCKYAQIELVSTKAQPIDCEAYVLVRPGHQVVPEAFAGRLEHPLLVKLATVKKWLEGSLPTSARPVEGPAWWSPFWHFRLPVTVEDAAPGALARLDLDLQGLLGPAGQLDLYSPRVIEYAADGRVVAEVPHDFSAGVLRFALLPLPAGTPAPQARQFYVYFDSVANGPKKQPAHTLAGLSDTLLDPSLEQGQGVWHLEGAELVATTPHSGGHCALLKLDSDEGTCVVSNASMAIQPDAEYVVSLWARTDNPGAFVMANLYRGPSYDFPQVRVDLQPDGQWHEYQTTVQAGQFPPEMRPGLRLWIIGKAQQVYLDDVILTPTVAFPLGPKVTVGQVERA